MKGPCLPLFFSLFLFASCGPDCDDVCEKLLEDCNFFYPGYSVKNCVADCEAKLSELKDQEQEGALVAEMECIEEKSCEEIEDLACYNEEFFE